ncbi:inositol monophosphatase family protein [Celerinatantimonas yamalensis]|uniref:Inositol monophosphatase n=1 Tax=Celerinatantimonas yamalensis TaxID=559956 RepID=A0ABW9G4L0_9GAMM
MLHDEQLQQLMELIQGVAQPHVLQHYRMLRTQDIQTKTSATDLVTIVDQRIEQQLTEQLQRYYPQALIIGEEAISRDPYRLDALKHASLAFIIDPIDGTWNFANQLSVFGVIVAVVCHGACEHALLYDPLQNDWQLATRGKGAFYQNAQGEKRPLTVSDRANLAQMSGFVSLFSFNQAMQLHLAPQLAGFARLMAFGCSFFEYRLLAGGQADFLIARDPKVWDHAAGLLLLQEAGGYSAFSDGEPYYPTRNRGLLLCANSAASWQALMAHFQLI